MARCRCGGLEGQPCGCIMAAGDGILISGTGSTTSPFVISGVPRSTGTIAFEDSLGLTWTVTGDGNQGDPYNVIGTVDMDALVDVVDTPTIDFTVVPPILPGQAIRLSGDVIGAALFVQTPDTPDIVWTRTGTGSAADPLVLSARSACVACDAVGNVGDVLTLQASGDYLPAPPNTVAPGTVFVQQGLTGDGSGGNPIRLDVCTYDDLEAACAP